MNGQHAVVYRQQMNSLASALNMDEETRLKAASIVRSLIDRVIVSPGKNLKGVHIEITGSWPA